MSCTACQPTKPVLNCIETLTIGTVTGLESYNVYFQSASNGKTNVIAATTPDSGVLEVTLDFVPLVDTEYKVWVTQDTATNIDATVEVDIDGVLYDCFYVMFKRIYGTDNATITATSQTLSI